MVFNHASNNACKQRRQASVDRERCARISCVATGTCCCGGRELSAQPADTAAEDFERRLREREAQLHQREAARTGRRVSIFDLQRESDLETRS